VGASRGAAEEAAWSFKILPPYIPVIDDEIDLRPGKLKLKRGGSFAAQYEMDGQEGLMSFGCGIVECQQVDAVQCLERYRGGCGELSVRAIEPNVGRVAPDERLETGDRLAKLPKIVATQLGFIDIAGLVRGAWRVRDARAVPLAAAI